MKKTINSAIIAGIAGVIVGSLVILCPTLWGCLILICLIYWIFVFFKWLMK